MQRSITVERAGLQSIVVDAGRFGLRHQGVAWCGPMDAYAYAVANSVLGNDARAAALEVVAGGLQLIFSSRSRCAVAGADCEPRLEGTAVPMWTALDAPAGARLQLARPRWGMRTIVAFDGGIDVPLILGSRTTDLTARFGGYCGRALRAQDVLRLGPPRAGQALTAPPRFWDSVIRVVVASQFAAICGRPWKIGHESNRMAWRLRGEPVQHAVGSIASRGVFPGMVQLPPSGEPIVLAADAQTTGGYPVAATVVEDDLWKLAQAPLGSTVQFVAV